MLNPLLIWFLPLAAIPIVLHLITIYRLRTLEIGTFRFLMESYVQQRRRLKLLEWLLMALRTLVVLLVVLTLARPVVDRLGLLPGGAAGRDVAIVLDASATGALRSDGTTALQRVRAAARVVIEKLSDSDYLRVIRAGRAAELLFEGYASRRSAALQALEHVESDITSADLGSAIAAAVQGKAHGPRVLYLLSDCRARTIASLERSRSSDVLASSLDVVVVDVGVNRPVFNTGIVSATPVVARPVVGLPLLLSATVRASPGERPVDTRLTLTVDGRQVAQWAVALEPGQTATRSIGYTPHRSGVLRGRFELTADEFPEDDSYLFTLNVEPRINVLVVTGPAPSAAGMDPRLYLDAALRSPLLAAAARPTEEGKIAQSLELRSLLQDQLQDQALSESDVVVAANLQMNPQLARLLARYVETGGGLLLLPGPHTQPDPYARHFFSEFKPAPDAPMPLDFGPPVGQPEDESTFHSIAPPDPSHPALSAFAPGEDTAYFARTRLFRYWPVRIHANAGAAPRVLMRTASGDALLVESHQGEGRLMVAGFASTPDLSDLPLRSEFVPLLLRTVAYLRRDAEAEAVHAVNPHEPARVRLQRSLVESKVFATTPQGTTTAVDLYPSERAVTGAFLQTGWKGDYLFEIQARDMGERAEKQALGFSVNMDAQGLDFQRATPEQVRDALSPARVTYLAGSPNDPVLASRLSQKSEMGRWLILALFSLFAAEFLLATLKQG